MFCVFDLDGTIADITHRVHHVSGTGKPNWKAFFEECVDDLPVWEVVDSLRAHLVAGHRVEIWSARSDEVREQTEHWLQWKACLSPHLLKHMRAADDNTPDVELKRFWLHQEDRKPDVVYDDRQRVVDMWRSEGITCFQVTENWEAPKRIAPIRKTLLTVMVGPAGAGKSTWCENNTPAREIVSSDEMREYLCGDFRCQERNAEVFQAVHELVRARLNCGLPVTVDATNLRRRDRLACVALAPEDTHVRYVVVDRPLEEKVKDGGWRNAVVIGDKTLVTKHHERMQSVLKDVLRGDGLPNVYVLDQRTKLVTKRQHFMGLEYTEEVPMGDAA